MAVQNFKCPNCGAELEMDDGLEKGYCAYCGSLIRIKDEIAKIKIEHTGKVEIDDTKRLANSMELANRAFASGNYDECYRYCCAVLECDIDNVHATFRKGLCAVCISLARISELEQAVDMSLKLIKESSDDVIGDIHNIFTELYSYVKNSYDTCCVIPKNKRFSDRDAADNAFSVIAGLSRISAICSSLITNEMMEAQPCFEAEKRQCLELGLKLCDLGVSSFSYFAGYERVKQGDNYVQKEVYKSAKSPFIDMQKDLRESFKKDFNSLPSTQRALMGYDEEITKLQGDIDNYTLGLEQYFNANPDIKKEYNRLTFPFAIMTGAAFTLSLFAGAALSEAASPSVYAPITVLTLIAAFGLGIFTIVRAITCSIKRKKILAALPPELMQLKTIQDQSKVTLQSVKQEKKEFVKNNIKK